MHEEEAAKVEIDQLPRRITRLGRLTGHKGGENERPAARGFDPLQRPLLAAPTCCAC